MTTQSAPMQQAAASSGAAVASSDKFPPGIPYIVGNEGAERFSFYGMRQILYIYLSALFVRFVAEDIVAPEQLAEAKVRATQVTHLFMAGVYLFPMIGAILADRFLGKYRVILWVSLIYCAGHAVLAIAGRAGEVGAFGFAEMAMFAGLALIAVGSGGIKPCVSANVGDQFTKENSHLVTTIFQIFYFMINFGSFFASLLTPFLYKRYGPEIAFGVPGILMGIATLIFWMGRDKFIKVPPKPGGKLGFLDFTSSSLLAAPLLVLVAIGAPVAESLVNAAMTDVEGAVGLAASVLAIVDGQGAVPGALVHILGTYWPHVLAGTIAFGAGAALFSYRQRIEADSGFFAVLLYAWQHRHQRKPGEDFWAPARAKFGEEAAEGPPAVLKIILVFSMVSVFWALFDQHSSTWVEQAKAMDLDFVAPAWIWNGFVIPATIAGAIYGAVWLFSWVSNRRLPKLANSIAFGVLIAWAALAVVLQLVQGGSTEVSLLPAQIAALNPLMVMLIIPILNFGVYRPLERRGRSLKPLMRMTIGMFLASVSFIAVAILQARIEAAPAGSVHVLWQVIPFLIITTAEVLVSVTGLEFAYTQAPRAMKSTIMGFWLLCVTFGNILVAFLAPLQKLSLATFFWTFAGLMAAAAVVFAVLAYFYKGKTYLQEA